MIIFKTPQLNNAQKIYYVINENIIKASIFDLVKIDDGEKEIIEEKLSSSVYFDLSNIEEGKLYIKKDPIISAKKVEGILQVEVLNYIGKNATEKDSFPEWEQLENEEIEIPSDVEIFQLEELIMPEIENKADELEKLKAENKALGLRLESMQQQLAADRRANETTTLELLELMMGML